jgi:predicted phosphoribosyltransferase
MYFKDREAAGRLLASQIAKKYERQKCAVIALNDGGMLVGIQIALRLRCVITMLLTENITMPLEKTALAGISHDGSFSYNHALSQGEIDDMVMEFHNFIELEKMKRLHEMHEISGNGQLIRRDLIDNHNVILVSDGLVDGFTLDLALEFLKPVHTRKIITATPLASIQAVDRMHILADDIYCLNVVEEYFGTEHYYDDNSMPEHDSIIETVERIVGTWK